MHNGKQQGVSIIEVLLSILVLSIGLLTLTKFQLNVSQDVTLIKQRIAAIDLAQSKLEELRNFQVLNTTAGKFAYADIVSGSDSITRTSATFVRSWTVNSNTTLGYKTVSVTVSWTDNKGVNQTVTLATVIGQIDPAKSGQLFS